MSRWLSLGLILLLLAGGCGAGFSPPTPTSLFALPATMTVGEIQADYIRDPNLADSLYLGRRFYFASITAEKVLRSSQSSSNGYVTVGNLTFVPRYRIDIDTVAEGTELEACGQCDGWVGGGVLFRDCWIHVLGGPTATTRSGY